jgi:hypothetical protein
MPKNLHLGAVASFLGFTAFGLACFADKSAKRPKMSSFLRTGRRHFQPSGVLVFPSRTNGATPPKDFWISMIGE